MPKFDFVDRWSRLPTGLWPIGSLGAFDFDPAGAGACRRVVR